MREIPPPLQSFMLYHRSMRADARRLVEALTVEGDDNRRERLARWFDHFRRACVIHAEGEDKVLWPALLSSRHDVAGAVAHMEAEHAALTDTLDDLHEALAGGRPLAEARPHAARLVELIDTHLDREEGEPLEAVVESFPGEALGELMRRIQQSAGPDGPPVAVPFLLAHATDEEKQAVLAALPPPLREGYETSWRAAYAELCEVLS